ncbi:MAG TPA: hypothetical protein VJG13_06920, partial [Thermoanaerobaculia bacterium]|nr:hypothetical protein [Thermoanaerobaculia bacterium]
GVDRESALNEAVAEEIQPEEPVELEVERMDAGELAWTAQLAAKLGVALAVEAGVEAAAGPAAEVLERVPLPWPIKRRLMKKLLRDVHHYLFNVRHRPRPDAEEYAVQDEIRGRMLRSLAEGAAASPPHVVVSHSMGTVVAYDCLKRLPENPAVDGLMTIGSPLGIDEIQDKMKPEWSREEGFPAAKLRGRWVNVYDKLDPVVGFDPTFSNDYRQGGREVVADLNEQSRGRWRHDITKYLSGPRLRSELRGLLGLD